MTLTTNQRLAVETLPATAAEIADALGYKSTSGVYDLLRRAEDRGYRFESNNGVWEVATAPVATDGGTVVEQPEMVTTRTPAAAKATVTKTANEFLRELEIELADRLERVDPIRIDGGPDYTMGGTDIVMFRTDDHFGGYETGVDHNNESVVLFNSDMAEEGVYQHLREVVEEKRRREAMGERVENVTLLMNGDHVTNEGIYKTQPHHIDATIRQQVKRASRVYVDVIKTLATEFYSVTVVCQHGNHGEFRADGASEQANADDLLYDSIELALGEGSLTNVSFIKNDVSSHTNFWMRDGKWMGHMRHGIDTMGHIGTNSAKKRWLAWLVKTAEVDPRRRGFDVGYYGHYHELKVEPVAGRNVLMGGTLETGGDYANSLGIATGKPGAWIHGVTDEKPVAWLTPVTFEYA